MNVLKALLAVAVFSVSLGANADNVVGAWTCTTADGTCFRSSNDKELARKAAAEACKVPEETLACKQVQ